MVKRSDEKPRRPSANGGRKLKTLYGKMRRDFTAADLQKYTKIEKGVPAAQVLAEMEEIHRKHARKRA